MSQRYTEIPPPSPVCSRVCQRPLPPYRYVPGIHPHPTRDPQGHRTGAVGLTTEEQWRYGIDLFNARYYFEAHEAWEHVWRTTVRGSPEFRALKGLIQIAASLLVLHLGRFAASRILATRGVGNLRTASTCRPVVGGLKLVRVAQEAAQRLLEPPYPSSLEGVSLQLQPEDLRSPLWSP